MIRIITGHSAQGGSTVAFINLTNALNAVGVETMLVGPHEWHLGKCRSEKLTSRKLQISPNDTLIFHFWKLEHRPPVKGKVILSCHEQNVFPLQSINYKIFDKIHFVSEHQCAYHKLDHPHFIIPNILDDLKPNINLTEKVAGIIGSVDRNKQTHLSIRRAMQDGYNKILIFGMITDVPYWDKEVVGLVDGHLVKYMGFSDNKQAMYDQITDVYFSSINECKPYVVAECQLTGKQLHVLPDKNYMNQQFLYKKEDIIAMWRKELEL